MLSRMDPSAPHHHAIDRCDPCMIEVLRRMSPAQKMEALDNIWLSAQEFVRAGVRHQYPEWTQAEQAAEVVKRMMGRSGE